MAISLADLARKRHQMQRLLPVLKVLARHGFGHLIERLNLQQVFPAKVLVGLTLDQEKKAQAERTPVPQRLRMALEEWGPTAVKFGQMLSTRPDVLPEPYIQELRKLTDEVPPFDPEQARRIVETELDCPLDEAFTEFEEAPLAAGSIAQVHRAVMVSGETVVVKVKRPGIERIMMADLDLIEAIAVPLLEWLEDLKPLQPAMLVREFRRSIRRELDFVTEAALTRKMRAGLADMEHVRVPKVYWDLTTSSVITLERLPGVPIGDDQALNELGVNRPELAARFARLFLHQYYKMGLFHADPHQGNLLVTENGTICLVDFGMVGRLDRVLRQSLINSFLAMNRGDVDVIVDTYMEIGVLGEDTDATALQGDMQELLDKYYGIPMHVIDMNRAFADVMSVARNHDVLLPRDFVLLAKSFCTMIMLARHIDPHFDIEKVARPFSRELLLEKLSPRRLGHETVVGMWSLAQALRRLPRDAGAFSKKLLAGRLQFQIMHRVKEFEGFAQEIDRATNRVAFSIIVSAIVIGSALILHARIRPHLEDILPGQVGEFFMEQMPNTSVLGLAGFLFAGILGLLLAWAIWRHGRL